MFPAIQCGRYLLAFEYIENLLEDDRTAVEAFLDTHFGPNDPSPYVETLPMAHDDILTVEKWNSILAGKRRSAPGEDRITYEMLSKLNPEVNKNIIGELNAM